MKNRYRILQQVFLSAVVIQFFLLLSFVTLAQQKAGIQKGVLHIKVSEEMAVYLENARMVRTANNVLLTGIQALDNVNQQYKVNRIRRVFRPAGKFEARHRQYGLHRWYEIGLDEAASVLEAVSAYGKIEQIEIAEPVYEKAIVGSNNPDYGPVVFNPGAYLKNAAALPGAPNDPLLGSQWHYNNTGQTGGTIGSDISLFQAWAVETGRPDVIVAVTDGGIQVNHPDLAASMWVNVNEIPGNSIDDDNNGFIDDINGYGFGDDSGTIAPDPHGTHVGGTVAATTNNGIGVAGVAGGSGAGDGARLMSLAAFGANDTGGFAETYVYGADMGAVISQNSWGYTVTGVFEQAVLDGIDYFIAVAGKDTEGNQVGPMNGGIVIFAAGNEDDNGEHYPGFYDHTLAVSGTTHQDKKAWYSNFGPWVDVAAPGGETDNVAQQGVLSTLSNNQYGFFQGTSMACPHVSGTAALIVSHFGGPGFTPEMLRDRLVQTTDNIDAADPSFAGLLGSGRINAFAALQENDNAPPETVTDLAATGETMTEISLTWTSPSDPGNGLASSYDIRYAEFPITEGNFDSASQALNEPAPQAAGSTESFTLTGLSPGTDYFIAMRSVDLFGNASAISNVVEQATNEPPVISISPSSFTENLQTAQTSSQVLSISNTGVGPLDFNLLLDDTAADFASVSPADGTIASGTTLNVSVTFDANNLLEGTYHEDLIITSNDPLQDTLIVPLTLNVLNNGTPIATVDKDTVDFGGVFIGGSVNRTISFHNAGSDTLTITNVVSDNGDFTSDFSGSLIVGPFGDAVLGLTFSPSTLGSVSGFLSISTNDPNSALLTVYLTGEGLDAPGIAVSPDSLAEELNTDNTSTQFLAIQNTGASDLEFAVHVSSVETAQATISEIELPMHQSALANSQGKKMQPAQSFKSSAVKVKLKSVATSTVATKVLLLTPDGDVTDLAALLNGFGDIDADIFPLGSLPSITLADVTDYDVIMTTNNTQWLSAGGVDPVVIGDLLADYIDQGGKVIVNQFAYSYDAWKMDGRFITGQYGPFMPSTSDEDIQVSLGTILAPNHPVMQGVDTLLYGGFVQNVSLAPGATALANWDNGELFMAANDNVVALNMLPSLGDGNDFPWLGDLPTIYQNAIHWLTGVSFLHVSPTSGTVAPGRTLNLEVTFDATGLSGGIYQASIDISSNAPGSELVKVPAVLNVLGPEFTVTPDSLFAELAKDETTSRTLVLTNNGTSDHPFSVSVSNTGLSNVSSVSVVRKQSLPAPQEGARVRSKSSRTATTRQAKIDVTSIQAIVNTDAAAKSSSRIAQASAQLYATDFENFALGDINSQNGWAGQFGNWTIESVNPSSGTKHFRGLADGFGLSLAFSPEVAIGSEPNSTATMKLNVAGTGVTWQIIPQSTTAQLVNTRVQFSPDGSAQALVDDGAGGAVFANIPAAVPTGYFDLTIETERATSVFNVYFNDEKVFTGQGFAGDIEELVVLSLMEVAGPTLDMDDVQLLDGKREVTPPFINVSPVSGNLGEGQSVEITVNFDATGLEFGTYNSDIHIDIAGVQQLNVPATLMVVGDPAIEVDPTVLQAVVPYKEDTVKNFEIRNTGGRPLNFNMQVIGANTELAGLTSVASKFSKSDARIQQKLAEDERLSKVSQKADKPSVLQLLAGTTLLEEHFEGGTFPPAGWNAIDNEGTGVAWTFASGYGEGNYSGTGEAATVSSDAFGLGEFDAELVSPLINVNGFKNITVQFNANYQNFANLDFLDLDIQVGDSTWTNVLRWNEDHGSFRALPGEFVTVELDDFLQGASAFKLRWHYYDPNTDDFDWYAQIDDIAVLGDPRAWLTVSPASGTVPVGGSVDIDAHFDSEDINSGFYVAGVLVNSNAVRNPLVGVVASLEVLAPAEINVVPDSITQELMRGEQASQEIVISNSGVSPLKFSFGGVAVQGAPAVAKERVPSTHTRTTSSAIQLKLDDSKAVLPGEVSQLASVELYATGFEEFAPGDIDGQEGWAGQFANWTIEGENPFNGAQHFRGLSDGFGLSLAFSPEVSIGTDEISSTTMQINLDEAIGATWQIITQSTTAQLVNTRFQLSLDGSLQALVSDSLGNAAFENINAAIPSGYFELRIDVVRATSRFTIFFNGEEVFSGQGFAGDIEEVVVLSQMEVSGPVFDMDNFAILDGPPEEPWLSVNPKSGVVPAGGSMAVSVLLNATDLKEGVYTDVLNIVSNDPSDPQVSVPVTLIVHENHPPVLAEVADTTVIELGVLEVTFTATDDDDSLVTVHATDLPAFVSLVSEGNGFASYHITPGIGDAGEYNIPVFAEDARGMTDSINFHFTVLPYGVTDFSLVNIVTGESMDFKDSVTLDVANPDFLKFVIRANTDPDKVGSVLFKVDGKKKNIDNYGPYLLNPFAQLALGGGAHTLHAEAYTKSSARGQLGQGRDVVIQVINSAAVQSFTVVNRWGHALMDLTDGSVINIKDPAFNYINIVANASTNFGSVKFKLNGRPYHTDNLSPFSMAGDWFGSFLRWPARTGHYVLEATPYSLPFGFGIAGTPLTIEFDVVYGNAVATTGKGSSQARASSPDTGTTAENMEQLTVSPVPTADAINIHLADELKGDIKLVIVNTQGQVVYSTQLSGGKLQDLTLHLTQLGLSNGMYYLRVQGNGFMQQKKIIKQ